MEQSDADDDYDQNNAHVWSLRSQSYGLKDSRFLQENAQTTNLLNIIY